MKNLKVKIDLEKNSAVLLTQRLIKQTLISFFSNLAGSVLGIMSLIGFIMNLIEPRYEHYIRKWRNRSSSNKIIQTGNHIKKLNFKHSKVGHTNPNLELRILDYISTIDNQVNISLQNTVHNEFDKGTFEEVGAIDQRSHNGVLSTFKKNKVYPLNA